DMTAKRTSYFVAILLLGLALAGCERKSISEINADPGRFMNKEVLVAGRVTQSIGAFGHGIYQVDDGTGAIWGYSSKTGVPSRGGVVGVKGHVMPTVIFLVLNYATVIQETARRHAG